MTNMKQKNCFLDKLKLSCKQLQLLEHEIQGTNQKAMNGDENEK